KQLGVTMIPHAARVHARGVAAAVVEKDAREWAAPVRRVEERAEVERAARHEQRFGLDRGRGREGYHERDGGRQHERPPQPDRGATDDVRAARNGDQPPTESGTGHTCGKYRRWMRIF